MLSPMEEGPLREDAVLSTRAEGAQSLRISSSYALPGAFHGSPLHRPLLTRRLRPRRAGVAAAVPVLGSGKSDRRIIRIRTPEIAKNAAAARSPL